MGVDLDLFCEALAVDTVIWSGSLDQEAVKKIFSVIKNTLSARIVFNIYFVSARLSFFGRVSIRTFVLKVAFEHYFSAECEALQSKARHYNSED